MRIKLSDLKLAMDSLPTPVEGLDITIDEDDAGGKMQLTYGENTSKLNTIIIYEGRLGITPELKSTTKLYRKV